jgi:hypothetical protein
MNLAGRTYADHMAAEDRRGHGIGGHYVGLEQKGADEYQAQSQGNDPAQQGREPRQNRLPQTRAKDLFCDSPRRCQGQDQCDDPCRKTGELEMTFVHNSSDIEQEYGYDQGSAHQEYSKNSPAEAKARSPYPPRSKL